VSVLIEYWWLLLLVLAISITLTAALRAYALARGMLDVPNDRSSHSTPTPRGGGVAIVGAFLLGTLVLWAKGTIPSALAVAVVGGGGIVAIVGFLDDHGHVAARWRLLAHFSAAAWVLFWMGGAPLLDVPGGAIDLGWIGVALCTLYLVWMLNLYNFMDGIDGIAAVEAVTVAVCAGVLDLWVLSANAAAISSTTLMAFLLAAAVLGFLVWNFPPAKIFMGDAGSGFLGLTLGTLSLLSTWQAPILFWCWVILLGVFVVDATVTLFHRLARRKKLYEAHRSHAYQHASRTLGTHKTVTMAVAVINLLWLFPLAGAVAQGLIGGPTGILIAYPPLVVLALHYKAGVEEVQRQPT
jgi:Fuc2NAc and GlcNAc transferase